MNQTVYPYTQGDLLAHPQTYQYSDYLGASFLEAWKKNRNTAIAALGGPVPPPPPKTESLSAGFSFAQMAGNRCDSLFFENFENIGQILAA